MPAQADNAPILIGRQALLIRPRQGRQAQDFQAIQRSHFLPRQLGNVHQATAVLLSQSVLTDGHNEQQTQLGDRVSHIHEHTFGGVDDVRQLGALPVLVLSGGKGLFELAQLHESFLAEHVHALVRQMHVLREFAEDLAVLWEGLERSGHLGQRHVPAGSALLGQCRSGGRVHNLADPLRQ